MRRGIRANRRGVTGLSASGYPFTDPFLIDWYEPDASGGGLVSKAANSTFGPLATSGGAVAQGAGLNGHPSWKFQSAAGGFLITAAQPLTNYWYEPWTIYTLVKDTGSAATRKYWGDPVSAIPCLAFNTSSQDFVTGSSGTSVGFNCTPANWNLIKVYGHSNETRVSVNGGAYTLMNAIGTGGRLTGVVLGAGSVGGGGRSDCEMLLHVLVEGKASAQFEAALFAYINAKFGLSLTVPAAIPEPTVTGTGLLTPPFDIVVIYGQSNATTKSTVATTSPAAGILNLNGDNSISQMGDHYCADTNRLDEVANFVATADSTADFGAGGALANTYQASTGRQLVIVDRAVGAAWVVAGQGDQRFHLGPEFPRGHKLRNSPYGALIAAVKQLQALGGTVRWMWYYQGESEGAAAQAVGDQWPGAVQNLWYTFFADIGMAGNERVIYTRLASFSLGSNWTNFITNTQPLAAVANKFIMINNPNTPLETDNTHLQGTACNTVGTTAANAALAAGW